MTSPIPSILPSSAEPPCEMNGNGIPVIGNNPIVMAGFNWATVPSVIVEMGVMTNPAEDRLLASSAYQEKLAEGMANGIMKYLEGR